jgi:Ni/Fe-hydrogenase subunit HybB-like protein
MNLIKEMQSNTYKLHTPGKIALVITTILGLIAVFYTLNDGHIRTNSTQHIPWGLWVATYIYFIGLSAGSFLLSSLVYVFRLKQFEAAGHVALVQAFICMVVAGFFIIIDLGHPLRILGIMSSFNPTSVMAWMGLFYGIYLLVIILELKFSMANLYRKNRVGSNYSVTTQKKYHRILFWLGLIGILIALGATGAGGTIFAVAKARPSWFGGLLPIVFIISALASGGGLLTFLSGMLLNMDREAKATLMRNILFVSLGFLALDYLMLTSEMLTSFYGGVTHETASWREMLYGKYWYTFWFLQLGIGIFFPVWVAVNKFRSSSIKWLKLAGLAIAVGIFGTRMNIVMPAQAVETIHGLSEANYHERFALGYFPSAIEIMLVLGGIAIFTWLFLLANKYLPLNTQENLNPNS